MQLYPFVCVALFLVILKWLNDFSFKWGLYSGEFTGSVQENENLQLILTELQWVLKHSSCWASKLYATESMSLEATSGDSLVQLPCSEPRWFPAGQLPAFTGRGGYLSGAGLCISLSWTSWGSCQPSTPACPGPSDWQCWSVLEYPANFVKWHEIICIWDLEKSCILPVLPLKHFTWELKCGVKRATSSSATSGLSKSTCENH